MATTRVYILAKELGVKSSSIVMKCQAEGLDTKNHMSIISAGLAATIREWFSEGENSTVIEKTTVTRVYLLAKELGVKSSSIVKKCQAEGLDIKNHMSVISAGLAATIREWFSEDGQLTTVEISQPVDLTKVRLKKKVVKKTGGDKAITKHNALQNDFTSFLKKEKRWSEISFDNDEYKTMSIDLSIRHPESKKLVAVIDFKESIDRKIESKAKATFAQFAELELGKYLVTPSSEKSNYSFTIYKYSDRGLVRMQPNDFPAYVKPDPKTLDKKLTLSDFQIGLDFEGSEICDKVIAYAVRVNGLEPYFTHESYVNLVLKSFNSVAAQLHRYGENETKIALAVVGPKKGVKVSEPELTGFVTKGEIAKLSGYKKGPPGELAWLNGNLHVQETREKASVYIINPEVLTNPEASSEVNELLKLARKYVESTGPAEQEEGGDGGKIEGTVQEHVKVEGSATVEVIDKIKIRGMSVAEHGWGDKIADKDKLGFRPYVEVVARFLTHEETELPLTLSVEGEWGSGKSSFLLQLKNEIGRIYKEKDQEKAFIVEFDPWRHDKDEALWAAFALKFIGDASKCLTMGKRWRANWELWKHRFQWRKAWPDLLRIVLVGLAWVLATIGICMGLWNGIQLGETGTVVLPKRIGSIVALIVSLWAVFGKVKDFLGSPLAVDLKKYMRRPDYVSKVSFIEKFHDDFKKIVIAYAGEGRVYVFIDDLDRCNVPKAAELMESINLMISENPKLVFIMGMDREKVAAGLAVKHEKLLPYLAGQTEKKEVDKEKKEVDKDEVKRLRGVWYGYSFIEKFIQVPFRLPQPDEKCISEMLMGMSGQIKEEKKQTGKKQEGEHIAEDMPQTQIETDKELEEKEHANRQEQIEEEFLKFDGDDPDFRAIVLMVSKAFDYNPRRAKQFVNIFRLRAATAKVTGLYEPKDGKRLTFEQLGKFVGIGLGWPLLIRDIERRPALLEELVGEAEGRTEGEADEKKDPKKNSLRFGKWADDEKLMELLKAGCENEKDAEKCRRFSLKGLDVKKLLQVAQRVMSDEEEMV